MENNYQGIARIIIVNGFEFSSGSDDKTIKITASQSSDNEIVGISIPMTRENFRELIAMRTEFTKNGNEYLFSVHYSWIQRIIY